MRRRSYLALAAASSLGGCLARSSPSDPADSGDSESTDAITGDPVSPGTVDDFANLDRWETSAGSLSADATRSTTGSHSARIDVAASEEQARIERTFDSPRDFSEVAIGLSVTATDWVSPWIQLVDADGDRLDVRTTVRPGLPFTRYNFGFDRTDGDPDLTAITDVSVAIWQGSDEALSCWIDDLHCVPRPDTGKVMIQFDDAHETDHSAALPILAERDYPATTFVCPASIGGESRLSLGQLSALDDAGWYVCNHTASHHTLTDLDRARADEEVASGKRWLADHGFDRGLEYFAYPSNAYDASTLEVVANHHEFAFGGGYPANGHTVDRYRSPRIEQPSADAVGPIVEWTTRLPGLTTLFYHRLQGDALEDFRAMVDRLATREAAGDVEVVVPSDVDGECVY